MNQAAPHQHKPTGLRRIWLAAGHSFSGLSYGMRESAFRQEVFLAALLCPAAFWLGSTWTERVLLLGCVFLVLIVELLNTGVEAAIDRIGPEWHEQSKRAKDVCSAAVLLSLFLAGGVWASALWKWWFI